MGPLREQAVSRSCRKGAERFVHDAKKAAVVAVAVAAADSGRHHCRHQNNALYNLRACASVLLEADSTVARCALGSACVTLSPGRMSSRVTFVSTTTRGDGRLCERPQITSPSAASDSRLLLLLLQPPAPPRGCNAKCRFRALQRSHSDSPTL